MTGVSAVMIPYNNEDRALTRLQRDLLPALADPRLESELIVIDNSAEPSHMLRYAVTAGPWSGRYYWQGDNLMYGPSLNFAVSIATKPYLLYVCTNHGRAYDPTWALDLLAPLEDENVAMTGCLQGAGSPEAMGFPADLPHIHVQGGVFAARTEVLAKFPYPDGEYAHYGADLYECFQLMKAGYQLVDVPTVRSVWKEPPGAARWKYLHVGGVADAE